MQVFLAEIQTQYSGLLRAEETRHCIKVLRHQIGDDIFCTDGGGSLYRARIEAFDKNSTTLQLIEELPDYGEHPYPITLAVSPLRLKDRFEWLVEKAVELGVTAIYPIRCDRTDIYKAKFKPERLRTIMLTAIKQCLRSRLPTLHPLMPYADYLSTVSPESSKLIGYCEATTPIQSFEATIKSKAPLHLLIGPEGDFTSNEVDAAGEVGFEAISLGANRLRTETAAIHALSLVKYLKGY